MDTNLARRRLLALGATEAPSAWKDVSPRERIRRRHFPNVPLQSHDGQLARFYDDLVKDKIVIINFMYVNCADGSCPVTTHTLAKVQQLLAPRVGQDVFMYSITLDPENDTPQTLQAYAKSHGAGPGWIFLRGSPRDTEVLRRKLGFWDRDPEIDRDKASHAAMIRYGNEPRLTWAMSSSLVPAPVIARAIGWVDDRPVAAALAQPATHRAGHEHH
jgi:protein SCO1/2